MSTLRVARLHKSYSGQAVLRDVDLDVPSGSVVALLGPSGCGKTTLLRLIAGFDASDGGEIAIDGRVVDGAGRRVPPEHRRIGYVPQEGTLFPHLTVAENVGFGLPRSERRGPRVQEVLRLTGIAGLDARYPHQLSGGQQQRTALARALAPGPALILLDEPFNALDIELRRSVCLDVIATLRHSATTAILVTHDPQEAFASADLVAVMRDGRIAQFGDPVTVYRDPVDAGVARLTGSTVLLPAEMEGDRARTVLGAIDCRMASPALGKTGVVFLRPEQIALARAGEGVGGRVVASVFHGDHSLVTVAVAGIELSIRLTGGVPSAGDDIRLHVIGSGIVFPSQG